MALGRLTGIGTLEAARRQTGLTLQDLWLRYITVGGRENLIGLQALLRGAAEPTPADHDAVVQALNERFMEMELAQRVAYHHELSRQAGARASSGSVGAPVSGRDHAEGGGNGGAAP